MTVKTAKSVKAEAAAAANNYGGDPSIVALRKRLDNRLGILESERWSWWQHWKLLARYIQPRLGRFIPVNNPGTRGLPKNQHIINNTGTLAAQRFAAGLLSGTSSPAAPWFNLRIGDGRALGRQQGRRVPDRSQSGEYLDECRTRMMHVFSESNFYNSLASVYEQLGVFGTGPMLIYEDFEDVIRCFPLAAGTYYLAVDGRLDVTTLYRKIPMTVAAIVDRFTLARVSPAVKQLHDNGAVDKEVIVCHAIEPNSEAIAGKFGIKGFAYRDTYWEYGSAGQFVLSDTGFHEKPFIAPRWNVTESDPYGHCPGMDALGDIIQVQIEEKRKAQAIDKVVNPPMIGDARLQNGPASVIPGGVTFTPPGMSVEAFKPIYQIRPELQWLIKDIESAEGRIKAAFFEDLFLAISSLEDVRSATEIVERKEEKMTMLGPPLIRVHREGLAGAVSRTFNIMQRARLLPPAPPALAGSPITLEFVSVLAQAQRSVNLTSIERVYAFAGRIAAVRPEIMDNLKDDEAIDAYADMAGLPAKIIASPDELKAIRDARAQQQQAQQAVQLGATGAQGAKVLSETDVGGGQNALELMTGRGAS